MKPGDIKVYQSKRHASCVPMLSKTVIVSLKVQHPAEYAHVGRAFTIREDINLSDYTELDPANPDRSRCKECPKVGTDTAVDCTTPGNTRAPW